MTWWETDPLQSISNQLIKLKRVEKLHPLKSKPIFSKASQMEGQEPFDFLAQTSFQLAPKAFWWADWFHSSFVMYLNSSRNFTCRSGKLRTEFTGPIAKSTSPGLHYFLCTLNTYMVCGIISLSWAVFKQWCKMFHFTLGILLPIFTHFFVTSTLS